MRANPRDMLAAGEEAGADSRGFARCAIDRVLNGFRRTRDRDTSAEIFRQLVAGPLPGFLPDPLADFGPLRFDLNPLLERAQPSKTIILNTSEYHSI